MLSWQLGCLRRLSHLYKGFFLNSSYNNCRSAEHRNTFRDMSLSTLGPDANQRLVWIDMEMTGLDPEINHILEIACIITDAQLNIVSEGPNIIVHQSEEILRSMNEWCLTHHKESGLWEDSTQSTVTITEAADIITDFVKTHTPAGVCPLAGSSVHGDKIFINKFMPQLAEHLHYRIVDVSTVKELCRRWFPNELENAPVKVFKHRALFDIKESIEELKYYKSTIFNLHAEPMVGSSFPKRQKIYSNLKVGFEKYHTVVEKYIHYLCRKILFIC